MPFFVIYLIKLSLSLSAVFLFYYFILRKLTFYNHNRWYLLGYTLLSFFIPFINIAPVLEKNNWNSNEAISWVPVISTKQVAEIPQAAASSFSTWNLLILILATGMLVLLVRLLLQLFSFQKMIKNAMPIATEGMNLYQVNENIIPFSFGNSIFINRHLHSKTELEEIIRHEFVHVKQIHSIDIIWGEILCMLNWYNPFAWLLKKSIRQNLEFIADNKVLENGVSKKEYQYLLLKVIGNNQYSIAAQFNFSSLKKRIAMMNKNKSAKMHLLRFLFLLPVLAVILVSFRKEIGDTLTDKKKQVTPAVHIENITDTVPAIAEPNSKGYVVYIIDNKGDRTVIVNDKAGKEVKRLLLTEWNANKEKYENLYGEILPLLQLKGVFRQQNDENHMKDFLKRNPDIKYLDWVFTGGEKPDSVYIHKKKGEIERYSIVNNANQQQVEDKYGALPYEHVLPPPPAAPSAPENIDYPTPPQPPAAPTTPGVFEYPTPATPPAPVDYPTPPQPPAAPTAPGVFEYPTLPIPPAPVKLPANVKGISISNTKVTVTLKNGEKEIYDFSKPEQKEKFEKKYENILPLPTPPPAKEISPATDEITTLSGTIVMKDDDGSMITGNEGVLITITKNTTPEQLEGFKKEMKRKGIDLSYDEMEYDNDKLVKITGHMKSKDSHNNFVGEGFSKLILAMIKKGERTWFKVNTTE